MYHLILRFTPLKFYSRHDEDLLFAWLKKIKSITKYEGVGRELVLHILSTDIPQKDVLNLIGVFERYKFHSTQLIIFMNQDNKRFFITKPWFKAI